MAVAEPRPPPRVRLRRSWLFGCLGAVVLVIVLALLAVLLALAGVFRIGFGQREQGAPPPGDPRRFDPVASVEQVQAYAGAGARLTAITARFVRADGTMDLAADYRPSPTAEYRFLREVAAPATAPPLGAGGNAGDRWYEPIRVQVLRPGEFRSVRRVGGSRGGARYQYFSRGMEREVDAATGQAAAVWVPAPHCSFKRLWDLARANGAPAAAVASIDYDRDGYAFRIRDTRFAMTFDPACTVRSIRK